MILSFLYWYFVNNSLLINNNFLHVYNIIFLNIIIDVFFVIVFYFLFNKIAILESYYNYNYTLLIIFI